MLTKRPFMLELPQFEIFNCALTCVDLKTSLKSTIIFNDRMLCFFNFYT